ncbi:pLS20_p028 family conjugation system transmembrane protein [Weissella paramesenteroides]|uniref:pLS20_p028 family conjugation system transmembrane protein n=1 Tax=Weissella paramesenteroides TaxID=1249 RepID=UPI0013DBC686|nr:hypothetical protein [Weissella paramesenteroides]NEZ89040.1 hypothetical protein [Weissella paramesenteroides]NFB03365.1 hypothetical protein [Weissella paramesenteroides]
MFGLMTLPTGNPTNAFYESWADYLQPKSRMFLSVLQMMCQGIADVCYDLANAVLTAWHAAWKLADFSSLFTSAKEANDMTGYHLVQYTGIFFMLGLIIMAIMMAIQLVQFNLTSGKRGKEWPAGIVTAIIIIAMVPMLITGGTKVAKSMNTTMLGDNTEMAKKGGHSILTDIWKNNSVDLKQVAQANFNVDEKHIHDYSPIKDSSPNAIVKSSIFTSSIDDKAKKEIKNDNAKKVFTKKQGSDNAEPLDKGGWLKGTEEVYPRVKVNWIGIIAAEIVFAIVGFLAIIELLVRFFRLAYYSLTLLALAFRDMEGKKAMQILHVMEGSILGVALLPLNLLLFFAFVQWGMLAINDQNLSWGPYTIVSVALLLAAGKGLLSGFALIDDWTGMPTGHGNTVNSLIGAGATVYGAGRITRGVTGAAMHSVGRTGHGATRAGKKTASAAQALKDKVAQAGKRGHDTQDAVQGGNKNHQATTAQASDNKQGGHTAPTTSGNKVTTNAEQATTNEQSENATGGIPMTSQAISQSNSTSADGKNMTNDTTEQHVGSLTPSDAYQPDTQLTSHNATIGHSNTSKGGTNGASSVNGISSTGNRSNSNMTVPTNMTAVPNESDSPVNKNTQSETTTSSGSQRVTPAPVNSPATDDVNASNSTTLSDNRGTNDVIHLAGQQSTVSTPAKQPVMQQSIGSAGIISNPINSQRTKPQSLESQYAKLQKELQADLKQAYPNRPNHQRS